MILYRPFRRMLAVLLLALAGLVLATPAAAQTVMKPIIELPEI